MAPTSVLVPFLNLTVKTKNNNWMDIKKTVQSFLVISPRSINVVDILNIDQLSMNVVDLLDVELLSWVGGIP